VRAELVRYNPGVSSPRSKLRSFWYWMLVLPLLGLLFPGIYARSTPALLGFPFFYWYQIAWILVTGLLTAAAYFAGERD
jgi:hypothetical protein